MKTTFERTALGLVGIMVVGLVGAVYVNPPDTATYSPRAVLRLAAGAAVPPKPRTVDDRASEGLESEPASTSDLASAFESLGYDYAGLLNGKGEVPRLFLASVPADMEDLRETEERKALFVRTVLPLILEVNERILADRERLIDLQRMQRRGKKLDAVDRLWLAMMADRYRVARDDMAALLQRVDIVPPSLAIAQAATESGWGTSRFAREGNALFGQWTTDEGEGLTPKDRAEGMTHKVRSFASLSDSVQAYLLNLNTHRAYAGLRKVRAELRKRNQPLDGHILAGELIAYSERGLDYVAYLRGIMASNNLARLDGARLKDGTTADNQDNRMPKRQGDA